MFQTYSNTLVNGQDFPLDVILYIDRTHISQNSKFKLCPVMASLTIFTEEACRSPDYWFKLGYIIDHNHLTKAEATTGNTPNRNQAHQNYHKICLLYTSPSPRDRG